MILFQSTRGPEGPRDAPPKNTTNFAHLRTVGREGCSFGVIAPPSLAAPWLYSLVFIELSERRERIGDFMSTVPSRALDDEGALEVDAWLDAVVFGTCQVVLTQKVETEAVLIGIEQPQQLAPQFDPKLVGQFALENRELHALPIALAGLGDATEAATPFSAFGGNIVGDQNDHDPISTSGMKRWKCFEVPTKRSREQARLDVRNQTPGNLVTK